MAEPARGHASAKIPVVAVATQLRRLRRRRYLDLEDVEGVTGWPADHILALENGAVAPLLSEVVTLAWLYGVDIERLVRNYGRSKPRTGRAPAADTRGPRGSVHEEIA